MNNQITETICTEAELKNKFYSFVDTLILNGTLIAETKNAVDKYVKDNLPSVYEYVGTFISYASAKQMAFYEKMGVDEAFDDYFKSLSNQGEK